MFFSGLVDGNLVHVETGKFFSWASEENKELKGCFMRGTRALTTFNTYLYWSCPVGAHTWKHYRVVSLGKEYILSLAAAFFSLSPPTPKSVNTGIHFGPGITHIVVRGLTDTHA